VLHDKDLILITVGAPRQQEEETVVAGDAEKKAIEALDKKPEEEKEAKMKEEKEKK
jgi:hypothetical protein